ncbi:MAG: glutamine amidotransferase [Pseudomonadota bacterium]
MSSRWALAEDLSAAALVAVGVVLGIWVVLLVVELRSRRTRALPIVLSGALALVFLFLALMRPARVEAEVSSVGARVIVLVDRSRRLLLPDDGSTREARARAAARAVRERFSNARVTVLGFADGEPAPLSLEGPSPPRGDDSDLMAALAALARAPGERPAAVVVVSDGRLTRPGPDEGDAELGRVLRDLGIPVHTVAIGDASLPDAAISRVHTAGTAVAHQPLALRIEIACTGGLSCGNVPVQVRELRQGESPAVLAEGVAELEGAERATLELPITLERAGGRVVEIALAAPAGDRIPENDRRILTFNVARQRLRLLHVAGRPTYDVRSLRRWLKSDESVDLVAFFILRTDEDNPLTTDDSELALIPFPVDELFTEHLPSFDAVILQDIDAVAYRLAQHLPALERYVRAGGGLIMVGGPSSFAGGGYARSPLERVLPVTIGETDRPFELGEFVPRYTEVGRVAPVLLPLRELVSEDLPRMVGSNTLGPAREDAIVLWEHPERRAGSAPMPVLALGDAGDGRAIALAVDGTHELAFSEFAERTAGRAYGALWDGLLGWLMRDPRYEAARVQLAGPCIAGEETRVRVTRLPGTEGELELTVEPLGPEGAPRIEKRAAMPASGSVVVDVGPLAPGGYSAHARVGKAPATRFDFACERGGSAWGDSRPDAARLERIARASGGRFVRHDRVEALPLPPPTEVATLREVVPVLPPWVWALCAAAALGWHWIERRKSGFA